jgi:transposase-like protein
MARQPPPLPFNRPRWTEREARAALAALERSRKPISVFAAEHGLDPQRLYSWRRRLGGAEPTTFRELIVRPPAAASLSPSAGAAFEIVLGSGVVVRVPESFDAAGLERLLEVLARAHAC